MVCKCLMLTAASLGLALVSTAPARAQICFEYTVSGGGVGVAIGAKLPAEPNTCERVTVVAADGGVATGSICKSDPGAGVWTLVYHYVSSLCASNNFETATCRLRLQDDGSLPSQKPASQFSSCTGMVAGVAVPGQTSPLRGFSNLDDLKVWNCSPPPFLVIGGGGSACFVRKR
jgi:hypothetical protein